jgi:hypothetical protein
MNFPLRLFFDTEFLEINEPGRTRVEMISIGIVREDGQSLYLENSDFDWDRPEVDPWLVENVKPHLAGAGSESWASPQQMRERILDLVGDRTPEWWAYVAAYDWIALISLFGTLVERPAGWPIRCRDLKDPIEQSGLTKDQLPLQDPSTAHDALADAKWNLAVWQHIQRRN